MSEPYRMIECLQQQKAQQLDSTVLDNGTGVTSWYNQHALVDVSAPEHHTLSLYVKDGYQSFLKTPHGWRNGGKPDRMCLMPKDYSSVWDIRGALSFVHFYFTDRHLKQVAESVWDKSPYGLSVDERIFADDPQVTTLYRQFLLNLSWDDTADRLALSSVTTLLLTHLVRHYTHFKWEPIAVTGGLAPFQLTRVKAYIEENLSANIQLADLAEVANLSEYHFARMFKQSVGLAPHQYVMQQRLLLAKTLLKTTELSLVTIALQCGFSSSGHFSNRFKFASGCTPSRYRQSYINR
ncbi:Transposon Tn10 TetD protein [Vibrio ruber DSM 16370]|uniref:Transposon Tn10 TetD protein n=1 Tax=Vibrio ruber (strain DSM 16370 / JCM 11486 / BCRC 17186 / CECT 7878 / LMG 23124 / VR1) TaxID=1123498 RepID=A0A1R4LC82_VIBR1|nr:helix-turn-helix domain-containing protein [Vibrio ruber]SJN54180.1 Transposon Tn10 TetD protein [Vibrio ruber DSM 16370]